MLERKSTVVALDLEGTLISNAVSQFPRPGLYSFLEYCYKNFVRIVIFTAVNESQFRSVAETLAEQKKVPDWFVNLEYIHWSGKYKDLRFISDTEIDRAIILDDREEYIKPEQRNQWIHILEYNYPYSENDCELKKAIDKLSKFN